MLCLHAPVCAWGLWFVVVKLCAHSQGNFIEAEAGSDAGKEKRRASIAEAKGQRRRSAASKLRSVGRIMGARSPRSSSLSGASAGDPDSVVPFAASPCVAPMPDAALNAATPIGRSGSGDSGSSSKRRVRAGFDSRRRARDGRAAVLCREFQLTARRIVLHKWFDGLALVAILYSSVCLALENPRTDPDSSFATFLYVNDIVICVIFSVECALKLVAQGPIGYASGPWNVLDFVIVIISILSVVLSSSLRTFKSIRTLRVLRPLRVIARNEGMKLVVNALLRAVPAILNVVVVVCLVFFMFSVVFVNLFKGGLYSCQGPVAGGFTADMWDLVTYPVPYAALDNVTSSTWANGTYAGGTSRAVCEWLGGVWAPVISQSFDNVGLAFLALFQSTTAEGWNDIEFATIDSVGIDMQPIRDYNPWSGLLMVLFMVFGTFFMINLFIGVIIDAFTRMKDEIGDMAIMTEPQRAWVRAQVLLMHARPVRQPVRPHMGVRLGAWDIVMVRARMHCSCGGW